MDRVGGGGGEDRDTRRGVTLSWTGRTLTMLSPLPSLFCHRCNGRNEMDRRETFSPGPGVWGLN